MNGCWCASLREDLLVPYSSVLLRVGTRIARGSTLCPQQQIPKISSRAKNIPSPVTLWGQSQIFVDFPHFPILLPIDEL